MDVYERSPHMITIAIDEYLNDTDKNKTVSDIYEFLNDREIIKPISNAIVSVKWRTYDETKFWYYAEVDGTVSDEAMLEHCRLLSTDLKQITPSEAFKMYLCKPFTPSIGN